MQATASATVIREGKQFDILSNPDNEDQVFTRDEAGGLSLSDAVEEVIEEILALPVDDIPDSDENAFDDDDEGDSDNPCREFDSSDLDAVPDDDVTLGDFD